MSDQPKNQENQTRRIQWLRIVVICILSIGALGSLSTIGLLWYYGRDLPSFDKIEQYAPPQMSKVYALEGEEVGSFYRARRTMVSLEKISPVMIKALLAAEDADFYQHQGLDYFGILRAIYNSLRAGRLKGSGSTITQQTVKNILLTQEKTMARKIKEILLTRQLEERFSKDQILNMYLNTIYFGHGREGIEEASLFYFGKHAQALEVHEAATIAGLIQSPERHTPRRHPESALRRRSYVIQQMALKGMITEGERDLALEKPLSLAPWPEPPSPSTQWWVTEVGRTIKDHLGKEMLLTGGLRIEGSLSVTAQEAATSAVKKGLQALDARQKLDRPLQVLKTEALQTEWLNRAKKRLKGELPAVGTHVKALVTELRQKKNSTEVIVSFGSGQAKLSKYALSRLKRPPEIGDIYRVTIGESIESEALREARLTLPQAALVALDLQTREVIAMVGGWSYAEGSFNRVTQARRQPGSAFKPFVYGAALESRKYTLMTTLLDAPEVWELGGGQNWRPQNYNRKFIGPVPFWKALAKSINSVAVRLSDAVGLSAVHDFARRAGIQSSLVDNLTIALGSSELKPLELVNAYATFLTGRYVEPVMVKRVTNLQGQELWFLPTHAEPVFSEDISWLMMKLLRGVVTSGSGQSLKAIKTEIVGKTGTSNEGRDAWFVGASPRIAFAVWVGYDHPVSLGKKEAGGRTAAPIAQSFLKSFPFDHGTWPDMPEGVVKRVVDEASGLLAHEEEKGMISYYLKGTEPTEYMPIETNEEDELFLGGDPE